MRRHLLLLLTWALCTCLAAAEPLVTVIEPALATEWHDAVIAVQVADEDPASVASAVGKAMGFTVEIDGVVNAQVQPLTLTASRMHLHDLLRLLALHMPCTSAGTVDAANRRISFRVPVAQR